MHWNIYTSISMPHFNMDRQWSTYFHNLEWSPKESWKVIIFFIKSIKKLNLLHLNLITWYSLISFCYWCWLSFTNKNTNLTIKLPTFFFLRDNIMPWEECAWEDVRNCVCTHVACNRSVRLRFANIAFSININLDWNVIEFLLKLFKALDKHPKLICLSSLI